MSLVSPTFATCLLATLAACPASGAAPEPGQRKTTTQKILFLDDSAIASKHKLIRQWHSPQRHCNNPILTGKMPWEKWLLEVNGRSVLFDQQAKLFKMWYGAPLMDRTAPAGTRFRVCYAVSRDGIRWMRPEVGQVDWQGSRKNNILKWGENWMRRPNVMLDDRAADPRRRFKMTYVDVIDKRNALCQAFSPDGIHWQLNVGEPWFPEHHNANLLGWDERSRRYVLFIRTAAGKDQDAVGRSTSPDFVTWTAPETVLAPRPGEIGADFKGLAAFAYGDLYLGWLWVFKERKNADAELAFSRDGVEWQRPRPGRFFFSRGNGSSWDSEWILPVAPVVHEDKIWIYYTGSNLPYSSAALEKVQAGWVKDGQRVQQAIGLATLRLDGFVSLHASRNGGDMTTRPMKVTGRRLRVNAHIQDELKVEILDGTGRPRAGFAAQNCEPIRADGLRHEVCWKGSVDLAPLRGQEVQLRFVIRDGNLYSFWFEE